MIAHTLGPFGLDSQFDFPSMWRLRDWARESGDAVAWSLTHSSGAAVVEGSGSSLATFVGNHDMARLVSLLEGADLSDPWTRPPAQPSAPEPYQRALLAHLVAFHSPGPAILYYGDEIGMAGAGDPDCRRPMRFDDLLDPQAWLLTRMRRLTRARSWHPALRRGSYRVLRAEGPEIAAVRSVAGHGALVVAQAADEAIELSLPAVPELGPGPWCEVLEGALWSAEAVAAARADGGLRVSLPARGGVLLLDDPSYCDLESP